MRIVHIDTGRELRGGQLQVLLLLRGMQAAGYECVLLARVDTPLWKASCALGVHTRAATLASVGRWSRQAELMHAHDSRAHTLAAFACRSCPFVVSRRVAFPVQRGWLSRWKYSRPARYLAVSEFVAAELERSGVSRSRVDVVPDGVEIVAEISAERQRRRIVALASRDPAKGGDLLAQAQRFLDWPIVYSEDLASDLPQASVFVYVTRSEGFGSAALLAMNYGVPVVASRVGGLPEVLAEDTGVLVENDPQQIASAIRRVLDDEKFAAVLRTRARQRVTEHFSREQLTRRTLESYARVFVP